jgi:hypothetical protein
MSVRWASRVWLAQYGFAVSYEWGLSRDDPDWVERTPRHEELLRRFGAPDAQRYSEVLLHASLLILPSTVFGSVQVHDAGTLGDWAVQIVFRQPGFDGLIGTVTSVIDSASRWGSPRFKDRYGYVVPYPPEPLQVAWGLVNWITEPLGSQAARLRRDDSAVFRFFPLPTVDGDDQDPPRAAFGQSLDNDDIEAVRARLAELDLQIQALNDLPRARQIIAADTPRDQARLEMAELLRSTPDAVRPVFEIPAARFRPEDYLRLRTERQWLASWITP